MSHGAGTRKRVADGTRKSPADANLKSGRYSRLKSDRFRDLIAQHEADSNPLDILPELAAARAVFEDFVNRYDEFSEALLTWYSSFDRESNTEKRPRVILDVSEASKLALQITAIAERHEKMQMMSAISRNEMGRVMSEMGKIVAMHVEDEAVQERISNGWAEIRL